MQKSLIAKISLISGALLFAALLLIVARPQSQTLALTPIRIGWQTAWVPQAQIALTLKHTDILEKNGLDGDFKGFSYGAPLIEAGRAGQLDVLFVADFPAISLLSKTDKFSIVARLNDFRNGLIVPANSPVQSINDLKGKIISIPFGSGPHAQTLKFIRENGDDPRKDYQFKNLDILEQSNLMQKGSPNSWGEIDAFATLDPTMAIFEENGQARALKVFAPVGVVLMSNDFVEQHKMAAQKFLESFIKSYIYYARNQQQANQWFIEETKFSGPPSIIKKMTAPEKNLLAKNIKEIDVKIYDSHLKNMQALADEGEQANLISKAPKIDKAINMELLKNAQKEIDQTDFDLKNVHTK